MSQPMGESLHIEIDFITCDGLGYCAEELPDRIRLDEWGYPMVTDPSVPPQETRRAIRAARACPVAALKLHARTDLEAPLRSGARR